MPVIRTTKTSNYTVVDNRFLKNTDLSLRSKGLFTQLLSLPDNWVYSISGLASLSRDGEDSIRAGIRELEQALSNKDLSNTELSSNNLSIIQSDLGKPVEANRREKTYTAVREQVRNMKQYTGDPH